MSPFAAKDGARSLIRDLLRSDAGLIPHANDNLLEVRIPTLAGPRSNRAVRHLFDRLSATEPTYVGTDFRLHYSLAKLEAGVT